MANNRCLFNFEDEASLCVQDQVQASAWSSDLAIVFSPDCNQDESFKTVQCQKSTRYCWCVDNRGNEIWGTKVRGQPNCTDAGRKMRGATILDNLGENWPLRVQKSSTKTSGSTV